MFHQTVEAGEALFTQGDADAEYCYVLASGLCEVWSTADSSSEPRLLGTLQPGELFGELSLLYSTPRSVTVRARVPTEVWTLSRTIFHRELRAGRRRFQSDLQGLLKSRVPFLKLAAGSDALKALSFALNPMHLGGGEALTPSADEMESGVVYFRSEGKLQLNGSVNCSSFVVICRAEERSRLRDQKAAWLRQHADFADALQATSCTSAKLAAEEQSRRRSSGGALQLAQRRAKISTPQWSVEGGRRSADEDVKASFVSPMPQKARVDDPTVLSMEVVVCGANAAAPSVCATDEGATLHACPLPFFCSTMSRIYRHSSAWEHLRRRGPLAELGSEDFDAVRRNMASDRSFASGETVLVQGETGTELMLLLEGEAAVTVAASTCGGSADGGSLRCTVLRRGDFCGELCALGVEQARSASVTAVTPCVFAVASDAAALPRTLLAHLRELADYHATPLTPRSLNYHCELGTGSLGRVLLTSRYREASEEPIALKVMQRSAVESSRQCGNVINERRLLQELRHPFVARLVGTFRDNAYLGLAVEYCAGGMLSVLLGERATLDLPYTRFLVGSVALALEHIHERDHVYRGLKASNVLLGADGYPRLVDFSLAKQLGPGERTYTPCGEVAYMSPELLDMGLGHDVGADWWALGVLLFECLHGFTPFAPPIGLPGDKDVGMGAQIMLMDNIASPAFEVRCDPSVAPKGAQVQALVSGLLRRTPTLRFGGAELRAQPFFKGFDWWELFHRRMPPPLPSPACHPLDRAQFAAACHRPHDARWLSSFKPVSPGRGPQLAEPWQPVNWSAGWKEADWAAEF